jgi:Fe-Mn family superoxide dismutase
MCIFTRMAKYTLPDLPYDYGALEPHISGKIMQLHHDKHHNAYVTGANEALDALADARAKNDFSRIATLEKALAFHVSGHVLHSLFWQNMAPKAGGEPTGALAEQIKADFGGFAQFKGQLTGAAATIMGSGWAALVWEPLSKRLVTTQIYDHQSNVTQGGVPILVLDAWEHAFYLQYGPDKKSFFEAVWNVWNWADVGGRFEAVRGIDLGLRKAG